MSQSFRYGVIDLAVAEELGLLLSQCLPSAALSLFAPGLAPSLIFAGPWVVDLAKAPAIAEALRAYSPDIPWGYYLRADVDIVSLRQTLRRFNLVEIPNPPREVLFRYWDPRVIKVFLKLGEPHSIERFFDFIEAVEYADGTVFARGPRPD